MGQMKALDGDVENAVRCGQSVSRVAESAEIAEVGGDEGKRWWESKQSKQAS